MEECKRRRLNSSEDYTSEMIQNQEKMILYLFEIGRICESTHGVLQTLQTKIDNMDEKIRVIEEQQQYQPSLLRKVEHMEAIITKMHHSFLKEIQQKDIEIATLKELHQNMIADYEKKLQYESNSYQYKSNSYQCESNSFFQKDRSKKEESFSFYS